MQKSYAGILKGTPYFQNVALGLSSKISYSVETEEKDLPDSENPGGGLADSFERISSIKLAFSFRKVSVKSLELAFGGTSTAVPSAAVTDEEHTVAALDQLIALDNPQDMSVALVVKNEAGTTTYIEGTDYIRKRVGIIPLTDGAITAAAVLSFSYTKAVHVVVQGLLNLTREGPVLLDCINERNNAIFVGAFHRVKMGVAKNVEWIGDDYVSFDVEGKCLKDETITDPAKSPYYEIKVGAL